MKRIAIIGAGPMGLSLAYFLKDKYQVTVFEADDRPGGMSASFDFDGFQIERYYHFINGPDTCLFDLLKQLGMFDLLKWTPTKMGIFSPDKKGEGILQPWGNPLALLFFKGGSIFTRLRYGFHALSCKYYKNLDKLDDIAASKWIRRWEGEEGYDLFWRFLFEKKFFQLADPLSAAWIASRIRRVAKSRTSLMEERLGYIDGGTVALINRLVGEIEKAGGKVLLSAPVVTIKYDSTTNQSQVATASGLEAFDAVVSTIPLPYIVKIIDNLPKEYYDNVVQIQNIGCACVLFRLQKPLTGNFWLNVNMPGWDIPGIIEYSNLRPLPKSYVYVPFYMPHDHPNWNSTDASIVEKARSYLCGVNPEAAATEEAVRVFRYEYSQPVCPPGFRHILPPYETGLPGIFAADTTHSFPEDRSIHECIRIAGELAEAVRKIS